MVINKPMKYAYIIKDKEIDDVVIVSTSIAEAEEMVFTLIEEVIYESYCGYYDYDYDRFLKSFEYLINGSSINAFENFEAKLLYYFDPFYIEKTPLLD
jgi:hypothetical protein